MKSILPIVILVILSNQLLSQVSKLDKFDKTMKKKVTLGMTIEEVKKIIGTPKAIESGFPDASEGIIFDIPEQVGQLNYSTWFYSYPKITITVPTYPERIFLINGIEVGEDMYNDYKNLDMVFFYKGDIIYPQGDNSVNLRSSPEYSRQPKNSKETKIIDGKITYEKRIYTPLFCIIFDKGTRVVANVIMLYLSD